MENPNKIATKREMKKLIQIIFPENYIYKTKFRGYSILVYPSVYSPHYSESSAIFLTELEQMVVGKKLMEVGSGTGAISLYLAKKTSAKYILATDINPVCVQNTRANFWINKIPYSCHLADVYPDQTTTKFDIILGNLPASIIDCDLAENEVNLRMGLDPSGQTLTKFIKDSPKYLSKNGFLLLYFNHQTGNFDFLEQLCTKNNKKIQEIAKKLDSTGRLLSLFKIF